MSSINEIEELVHRGMVLDEHGGWIPLAEKLRKEKEFLHHLEQGEILHNGLWTKISVIPRTAGHPEETRHFSIDSQVHVSNKTRHMLIDKVVPVPDETTLVPLETQEETVSYSTETLRDVSPNIVTIELKSDYPPETKIFSTVRPGQNVSTSPEDTAINKRNPPPSAKTKVDDSLDRTAPGRTAELLRVPPETEFEETVLYNINVLRQTDKTKQDITATETTTHSRPLFDLRRNDDFSTGNGNQKRKNAAAIVVAAIIVILLLAVLIKFLL